MALEQLSLSFDVVLGLPCAFGNLRDASTFHHCQACAEESARGRARFAAAVAAGTYDARGYTPAERAALAKRAKRV